MNGYCRGENVGVGRERKDKYTEQIINDWKVPAEGHRVKLLPLHAQRKMTKCGKKTRKMFLLKFMTLWSRVGGSSVCSCRSVLMAPLGVCIWQDSVPVSISPGVPSLATLPRFISVQRQ